MEDRTATLERFVTLPSPPRAGRMENDPAKNGSTSTVNRFSVQPYVARSSSFARSLGHERIPPPSDTTRSKPDRAVSSSPRAERFTCNIRKDRISISRPLVPDWLPAKAGGRRHGRHGRPNMRSRAQRLGRQAKHPERLRFRAFLSSW